MRSNPELHRKSFEEAAQKSGFCTNRENNGEYEDCYLQVSWEIFCNLNFSKVCRDEIYQAVYPNKKAKKQTD